MDKEIKEIITINGKKVYRITTPDERFYGREITNEKGLPEIRWYPSATWIKSYYYQSPHLIKWIVEKGLTESERIKKEAGTKGTKVHKASEDIDKNGKVKITAEYLNQEKGAMEELTAEELICIQSYKDFIDYNEPELLANEMTVFSKEKSEEEFAGTLDKILAFKIKDGLRQIAIVDLKTGKYIYKDQHIQVSFYSHSDIDYKALGITDEEWKNRKLYILQLGYNLNKKKYKLTEVPDRYDLCKIAYNVWKEENPKAEPRQMDFPIEIVSEWRMSEIERLAKKRKKVAIKKNK